MSKEIKPQIYNFIRRGWYDHLISLCDSAMQKKGKDPLTVYWKAFGVGMLGNIGECVRLLESLGSRKDLQYPVGLALLYFHKKAKSTDSETIGALKSENAIAEDVTKEPGLILAARFFLFTSNLKDASRLSQKVLNSKQNSGMSTAFEMEAMTIQQWCCISEIEMLGTIDSSSRKQLLSIDEMYVNHNRNNGGDASNQLDAESLMAWAKSRQLLNKQGDVLNILNQIIATYPWFLPALADKALLLASDGEWEQALDTAQRLMDIEEDNLDALKVIAVHAFTQESQPDDAVEKFQHLDTAIRSKENACIALAIETSALFSSLCARQPRVLEICVQMLRRAAKISNPSTSSNNVYSSIATGNGTALTSDGYAQLLIQLGTIHLLQGGAASQYYAEAMKTFQEATKRDPSNAQALQAMILCQICEGALEDAEAQMEVLTLMHAPEELGYEYAYLQSLLLRGRKDKKREHLEALMTCKDMFVQYQLQQNKGSYSSSSSSYNGGISGSTGARAYMNAFNSLLTSNCDFSMRLATDFFSHMEATTSISSYMINNNSSSGGSSLLSNNAGNVNAQQQGTAAAVGGTAANGGSSWGGIDATSQLSPSSDSISGGAVQEISRPVQFGLDLLQQVLRCCPGMISAYVEQSRCYAGMGMFDEAARSLQQCLVLQPHCSPVLVALASVEAGKFNTVSADRVLEQALACDFSIRSAPRFRLVKAIIRAQQGRIEEAITEIELVMTLPELNYSLSGGGNKGDATNNETKSNNNRGGGGSSNSQATTGAGSSSSSSSTAAAIYTDSLRLTEDDRVGAFVCYSSLLGRSRRMKEANKVLSHAKVMFAGSSQEVQVLVAASQLYVEKSDFDSAIRMLDKIPADSPTFARAQLIKADIVLNHNHDKEGFTKCYQQLAERDPSGKNFALLGEAYLRILNPEAAIDALQQAYKLDPKNGRLRGRIGRALVATHEYHRAVEFYEAAIREVSKAQQQQQQQLMMNGNSGFRKSGSNYDTDAAENTSTSSSNATTTDLINLSHDLSKLYIKLGRAESSIRVLNSILSTSSPSSSSSANNSRGSSSKNGNSLITQQDVTAMRQDVTTLLLLAQVQRSTHLPAESLESLLKACELQRDVIQRLRSNISATASTEVVEREKFILSDLLEKLANSHADIQQVQRAEECFKDAVQQNPQNIKAILGYARILYNRNDKEQCQAQCVKIITAVPQAEEAAILLSEVLFHSSTADAEAAVAPLLSLLALLPNNYMALEKAICLLRRAGKLEQVSPLLVAAERADRRCMSHAGYHYCRGLYARFTNDIGRAISAFNLARKDEQWGAQALTHMAELYLNPDQEGAWEEKELGPVDETTRAHIATAEELLRELRPITKDAKRVKVLENYCSLATRHKPNVDRAMQSYIEMLEEDQDYLPAVLGMATGFMIEKNQHKARNLLKRVGKMEVSNHDGEDFEKANLLLAKFYIDKSKNDLAQELCRKTLLENKSCSQAWEILGLIFEKESNYELASDAYAKAWKLEFEASAPVGFKLAFSYLKCKKYVEAIDVCELVLRQYPDYPRITEEILRKAQESIRTAA